MRTTLLATCLGLWALPAFAAGDPNAAKGILVEHCADCHAVPGYREGQPPTGLDAPSFEELAQYETADEEERIRASLRQPHWPMTGFILSTSDIDNIVAYLTALRSHGD